LTATASAILGPRNSVQYLGFADQPDEPDSETGELGARQVDIDRFRSLTFETRLVQPWRIGEQEQSLAIGASFLNNRMIRRQHEEVTQRQEDVLHVVGDGLRR